MAENPFAHFSIANTVPKESTVPTKWETASLVVVAVAMVVAPLLIITNLDNFILSTKNLVLFVTALIITALFVVRSIQTRRFQLALTNITLPLLALLASSLVSTFFTAPYPIENLLGNGGLMIASVTIALLGSSILPRVDQKWFWYGLTAAGTALGATSLLQALGIGPSRLLNAFTPYTIPNTLEFSLSGSSFIAFQVLLVISIVLAARWWYKRQAEWWLIAGTTVSILGALVMAWAIMPGKVTSPLLLPVSASWSLALDTLREPRTALIGVGPENVGDAYQIFKPAWMNGQSSWNIIFNQGSNAPLTLLVSNGLLGLAAWLWLVVIAVKGWMKSTGITKVAATGVVAVLALQLLVPLNPVLLLLQAVLIAYWVALYHHSRLEFQALAAKVVNHRTHRETKDVGGAGLQKFSTIIGGGIGVLAIAALFFLLGRSVLASNYMYQSAVAGQSADVIGIYNAQQRAVQLNPFMETYRQGYAITNLQIAMALSNKTDLTEQEKDQIGQLIQQSVREARAATVLNPSSSQSWRIMAEIYRNLIGSAQDADQWAVNAYVQAIQLSPTDPTLRNQLGGIFYTQEQFNQALTLFQQAAELKPDLPNSYYNLANVLVQLQQYDQAQLAYEKFLSLVPADSEGYTQAMQELEALDAMKAASASGTMAQPQTSPAGSLLDQALSESGSDVVAPADNTLPLNELSNEASAAPSSSPAASPAVTGSDL